MRRDILDGLIVEGMDGAGMASTAGLIDLVEALDCTRNSTVISMDGDHRGELLPGEPVSSAEAIALDQEEGRVRGHAEVPELTQALRRHRDRGRDPMPLGVPEDALQFRPVLACDQMCALVLQRSDHG